MPCTALLLPPLVYTESCAALHIAFTAQLKTMAVGQYDFVGEEKAANPAPVTPETLEAQLKQRSNYPEPHLVFLTSNIDPERGVPWCPDVVRSLPAARRQAKKAGGTLFQVNVSNWPGAECGFVASVLCLALDVSFCEEYAYEDVVRGDSTNADGACALQVGDRPTWKDPNHPLRHSLQATGNRSLELEALGRASAAPTCLPGL